MQNENIFQGRIDRKNYILGLLFILSIYFIARIIIVMLEFDDLEWIFIIINYLAGFFTISLVVRRFHDINWSGWSILLLAPIILLFKKGMEGRNKFGDEFPKDALFMDAFLNKRRMEDKGNQVKANSFSSPSSQSQSENLISPATSNKKYPRLFGFIKSIFNSEYSCEYFIDNIEKSFNGHKYKFPGYDQHFYLMQTWLAYMGAKGEDVNDPNLKMAAFQMTYLVACVPHSLCVRALGIFLLYKERPETIQEFKKFGEEFNKIILPVMKAQEEGTIEDLYKKYNPNMDKMDI